MDAQKMGEAIRHYREKAEKTQERLGLDCSLSRASIANIERGHHRVHADTLFLIAKSLNVSMCTLCEGEIINENLKYKN